MEYILDMREISLDGDLLDIGKENYGIIYNLKKNMEDEISVDYFDDKEILSEKEAIFYDGAVLFFTMGKIWSNGGRREIIKHIWNLIKDDGYLYIWDYDKKSKEVVNSNIKVLLPGDKTKEFRYRDINPINQFNVEIIKKATESYFEIEKVDFYDKIYFVKAKRRERTSDENIINRSKFKIHS
ncbi:hypothetical protein [Clostridium folliculivorans]|uniref:Uncharacterized protein n=1 Tax=Clostridium folliculivorans TaxID=2886038 RepID=A0A9W6DAU7_9CLOT|nr:hypothetical protein [Clostridium folliculivorans]GKU25604.1 hypothetical protein CFOLD11_24300 [Clostridium folliculivorans]GKU28626.1 hypothetical protein CFB3_07320 [Clostridium folliculivorans]